MGLVISRSRLGSRGRPEQSRAAILQAAVREFACEGIAGARTDAIARSAKVNKALLYYYFKDKEDLYGAVLDQVFGGLVACVGGVLSRDLPPREKILAYAGAHFDYVASEVARGVQLAQLDTGIPVIFCVLTCDTLEQAIDRAGLKSGNKGYDAGLAAVEMANLAKQLRPAGNSAGHKNAPRRKRR